MPRTLCTLLLFLFLTAAVAVAAYALMPAPASATGGDVMVSTVDAPVEPVSHGGGL
jgi:hypothetical protein